METLARYRRPTGAFKAALDAIEYAEDYSHAGTVPATWLSKRMIGSATIRGTQFADIYSSEWLAYLRGAFEIGSGPELDLARLLSQDRSLTQQIATHAYRLGYDGIYYPSRHGRDLFNWAIFEPFGLEYTTADAIDRMDPDLLKALERLALRLEENI